MPSPKITFEGLLEAVPDALVGVDESGEIQFVNHQTETMFGYRHDELIGRQIEILVPESRREIHVGRRERYLAAPKPRPIGTDLSLSGRRADGSEFPVEVSLSCSDAGDGPLVIAAVRDVTERRRAQSEHEAITRRLAVVEFSAEAIIGTTLDGIVTSWNPAAEKLTGYSAQETIGESVAPLVSGTRAAEIEEVIAKVRSGKAVVDFRTVGVRKDGTEFAASISASPLAMGDGQIIGASATVRDVTAQRDAFEASQRMASIIRDSQDAIVATSLDDVVTSWNPAAQRMFGWSGEEIIGRPGRLLAPADRAAEVRDILARIGADQPVEPFETVRVRQDGTPFPVSMTVSPIRDADGKVIGGSSIARDLSAETAATDLSRAMIEASLDSIVSISPDGMITNANQATVELTGVVRDKLIGTSFPAYFTDPGKAEAIYQQVFEKGYIRDFPLTLRHQDGHQTSTEVLYNASVLRDAAGHISGVLATARDVTELKRAADYARSLLEAAVDPMVTISPEGKITDTNEATVKLTGVARDQLIGTSFSSYFTDPQKAEAIYQKVFEEGFITNFPLTARHHNGRETRTEVLYNASVFHDAGGNILGVFASARDVTKQILAQRDAAYQQARELDRLAELERFQRLTVGRELKMIELKKEIEYLRKSRPESGDEVGEY